MTAITNSDRAETAMRVIDHFCDPFASDLKACIAEIIGDLLHLAHVTGANPDEIIERARGHYAHEIAHDCDGVPSQYLAARLAAMKEAA